MSARGIEMDKVANLRSIDADLEQIVAVLKRIATALEAAPQEVPAEKSLAEPVGNRFIRAWRVVIGR